jgi:16S rRNA (guanine527-N7)-methyltransferase
MSAAEALAPYHDHLSRPPEEVAADLESFAALLAKWNRAQNLVSRETFGELWTRHIADSLQLLPLLQPGDRTILDLGSGGGFPAIPLAIATRRDYILVEPVGKKASFLKAVSRDLDLGLRVEARRAETIEPAELPPVDIVTSRALAPLVELCGLAAPFFGPGTRALFHKGREHVEELAESRVVWHHDVIVSPSRTDARGVLLTLTNLSLKSKR